MALPIPRTLISTPPEPPGHPKSTIARGRSAGLPLVETATRPGDLHRWARLISLGTPAQPANVYSQFDVAVEAALSWFGGIVAPVYLFDPELATGQLADP